MNLVDTPGTNVILQRQQRLTEEFVPRADLVLFVLSADRPLTESEVSFFPSPISALNFSDIVFFNVLSFPSYYFLPAYRSHIVIPLMKVLLRPRCGSGLSLFIHLRGICN
jgi:hypothetical protein